ncbi:MAG: helix-hairpin-helix domain-containing protein, partial [bacterium]|nr:helix-hairpin-helix domain-containing protein [bacterium]
MHNQELVKIFYEISNYLEMDGVPFKPQAYQKVAEALGAMEERVEEIYKRGGTKALEEISGVGKNIAETIEEYLKTGKVKYYEQFKKRMPLNLEELNSVEGMGPRKIKILYQKLKIKNLKDLEKAAKSHKIAPLFGFGEKTEKNIIESITFLKRSKGRFLLGEILPQVKIILDKLKTLKEVKQASVAGSVRRMKETIGDVDILVTTKNPTKVMDFFVSLPGVVKIWAKGSTKSSVRMEEGFDVDLRAVRENNYGSALQYFTGSKEHNIMTRRVAMDKGLKLSEYGLFRKDKMIAGWDEKELYNALGLKWVEPELRENQGEVEAGLREYQGKNNGLPKIIGYKDIKGDLHCHSDWDGGENSIADMAKAA